MTYLKKYNFVNFVKLIKFLPIICFLILIIIFTPIKDILTSTIDVVNSPSTYSRYVVLIATLITWYENNILFGVGLGQTGFYSYEYISIFPAVNHELVDINNHDRWPFIHNFNIRILAELGLIGFLMWIACIIKLFNSISVIIKNKYVKYKTKDEIGYAALTSLIGLVIASFSRENLTNMNMWMGLGLIISYLTINKKFIY